MTTLVVIAKECLPGRVKTRLTPPLTPETAARLAEESLVQTMRAAREVEVERRILYLDGGTGRLDVAGFDVVPQPAGSLDARIGALLDTVAERMLLIGMDTPQVRAADLQPALVLPGEAWFGPASDGGFWALGLDMPRGALVRGVPMSRADTGRRQLDRLRRAGLAVRMLPRLTDVDTYADARAVARLVPATPFGRAVRRITATRQEHVTRAPRDARGRGSAPAAFPAS